MSTIKNYLWFVFKKQKAYSKLKEEKEETNQHEQNNSAEIRLHMKQSLSNISLHSIERLAPYI